MAHVFKRENGKNLTEQCQICNNRWRPGGEGIAAYVRCKECGLLIHSSCRSVAEKCGIRCCEAFTFTDLDRTDYSVQVTIEQIADIGVSDQSYVYAIVKSCSKSLYRSPLAIVEHQSVSWPNHVASVNLHLSDLANNSIVIEIWSSFYDIMDQHQYSTVIDLQPLTRFNNKNIATTTTINRWFSSDAVIPPPDDSNITLQTRIFLGFLLIFNPPPPLPSAIVHVDAISADSKKEEAAAKNESITTAAAALTATAGDDIITTSIDNTTMTMTSLTTWTNNLWTSASLSLNQTWNQIGINNLFDDSSNTKEKPALTTKSRSNSLTSGDLNPAVSSIEPIGVISVTVCNLTMVTTAATAIDSVASYRVSLLDNTVKKSAVNGTNSTIWSANTAAAATVSVAHYRTPITVEVVTTTDGRVLGQGKISAYQILQQQADSLLTPHQGVSSVPSDRMVITISDTNNKKVAFLECKVNFTEDVTTFFWSSLVKSLPASPDEEVSIDRLGTHVARFRAMITCFANVYRDYLYLMEWKDPMLTSLSFLLFLYCTVYIQPQYALSGVLFMLILLMTRAFLKRRSENFKTKFLHPFIPSTPLPYMPVVTMKIAVLGYNKLSYPGGNFSDTSTKRKSRVLSAIKVSYIPDKSHFPDAKKGSVPVREVNVGVIACSSSVTNTTNNTSSNDSKAYLTSLLSHFISSEQIKPSDVLLFNIFDPWPLSKEALSMLTEVERDHHVVRLGTTELALVYPIVLNIRTATSNTTTAASEGMGLKSTSKDMQHVSTSLPQQKQQLSTTGSDHDRLCPSPSQVHRKSPELLLPDTHHSTAATASSKYSSSSHSNSESKHLHVDINGKLKLTLLHNQEASSTSFLDISIQETLIIPLQDVLLHGEKMDKEGLQYEYTALLPAQESTSASAAAGDEEGAAEIGFLTPQKVISKAQFVANKSEVLLRIHLTFPASKHVYKPSQQQILLSHVLQELQLDRNHEKESSTLSVLWNVRDHVKHAQNLMAWILDSLESGKNLLNWTLPMRTLPLYLLLVCIWLLTVFISSQHLVLIWGLYQFLYVILPIPEGNEITIRFCNLLQSIPNDDDLMEIYAEERKKFNEARAQLLKVETTEVLLQSCLTVQWSGSVQLRCHRSSNAEAAVALDMEWMNVYLILQGHRLVWWMHEDDVSKGNAQLGQLILSQVAGITQVSPIDSRKFAGVGYLLSLFGEDQTAKPLKVSLHFEQVDVYEEFKRKIESLLDGAAC